MEILSVDLPAAHGRIYWGGGVLGGVKPLLESL